MSEINNSSPAKIDGNGQKEMSRATKILIGIALGLLTVAGITLSGAITEGQMFRLMDNSLKTVLQYLWVGVFLVYIFWFRSIENQKQYSMKPGRMAYLIVIGLYVIIMLILNLTGNMIVFDF